MVTPYDGPAAQLKVEFRSWAKLHMNIITPKVARLFAVPEDSVIIEVAEGTDFDHDDIFGVTPWRRVSEFKFQRAGMHEHRQLFQGPGAREEAMRYAAGLKEWFGEEAERQRKIADARLASDYRDDSGYLTSGDDPTMPGGGPPIYHGPEERYGGRRAEVRVRSHTKRVK